MSTTLQTPQEPTVSRESVDFVLKMFDEKQEQVLSLLIMLENSLADQCNDGGELPNDAPLIEWRVAQVIKNLVESTELMSGARKMLGFNCGSAS